MSKWIRRPRICEHCNQAFFARGPKRFCTLECELRGSIEIVGQCWEWRGARVHGYGLVRTDATWRYRRAHRIAYEQWVAPIPEGMCVCHRCDNRCCINPAHLFLGTSKENTDDKVAKGRQLRGEKHGMARIPRAGVKEILRTAGERGSGVRLARKYGVTPAAVCAIRKRKNWKHL